MQRKSITAPIVSATSLEQLEDLREVGVDQARPGVGRRHRQGERALAWKESPMLVFRQLFDPDLVDLHLSAGV